ncbi:CocE/NonD family hydrolase [Sphingomonas cannabina]|uniref:CocE/NonD family hydrolase n=1 Tax=Sphingomonas cannabina TaxID=2899123 RepID=UPI001F418E39|nr:CocE/NonD family hydrolase [Sphingomonas cannabina]UIJ44492.1 CocE/NonD family hydrolase [Sphingomonas cannabina]
MLKPILLAATALIAAAPLIAQTAPAGGDIPPKFAVPPSPEQDYDKREVMIPMRDGTKLYTVIVVPKGATNAPIVLTRTPYNAKGRAARTDDSPSMLSTLPLADEIFVKDGYIRVYQDIRGKYGSEGDYVVTRPPIGPLNPTKVDHTTDAYDTIDWLVNKANLPESNGRVGMIGSSYEGFTVVMALLNPHPALKVAAPESPMVDGWMGDDWFHYGAFRLANIAWIGGQTGFKGRGAPPPTGGWDDYDNFRTGSAGDWAAKSGYAQLPFWKRMSEHPAYDAFWQGQALDKLVAANPSNVPTLWEQGLWDHEDMWGAIHSWEALKKAGKVGNNYLVMGPWRHSQVNREGRELGPFEWNGDTAAQFREDMVLPFFNQYLKDGPPANLPTVAIYNTGENHWDKLKDWPLACQEGCPSPLKPIYLGADGSLGFDAGAAGGDSYVSDPAKPVPHLPRPVNFGDGRWGDYLVTDQRFVDGRPDVMTYQTEVLKAPVRVSGAPIADIFAKTTGTDGDFVVKVIDVYPSEYATDPKMGGYQWPIAMDIFRGRYRDDPANPKPIPAGKVQEYKFRLPTVNHVFQPGHRIMIQVQSSLFPVYDRNPQKYVPNIFYAKKDDYQKATVTIMRGGATPSRVLLPVVPVDQSAVKAAD